MSEPRRPTRPRKTAQPAVSPAAFGVVKVGDDIETLRLNTAFTCISGQYTLVGVVSPKDAKGETDMTRKVMVFVKCEKEKL